MKKSAWKNTLLQKKERKKNTTFFHALFFSSFFAWKDINPLIPNMALVLLYLVWFKS